MIRPTGYRGRHRRPRGHHTPGAAPAAYSPLEPADRVALAPTHWGHPDRYLPAGPDARTGWFDTREVAR